MLFFCLDAKEPTRLVSRAGKSRLIFTSLKTTQILYRADSKPLRLCIPLVPLVGCKPPLPRASGFACITMDLKSRPVLTF